ncbi:MAG: glycosyltransferase family 4 protein [Myxococcota bacterium]|nr:glycosyltransferase family 4 protein [Myxococcota bacterium]
MRIGIVTEYYRPWPGGISEHVHHQAEELSARGHEVKVITGPATPGWKDEGPEVLRLGFEYKFTSNGALSRMVLGREILNFRRSLRRHALDVVHVHAPMEPFLAVAALYASECTTVGTFHANFEPSFLWETLFRRLGAISRPAWERMHARIAVSAEARRSIAHYFPGDYEIIPNGVDTARFHPEASRLPGLDDDRPKILFVGRADPRKGLSILLRAFDRLRVDIEGLRLVVVGAQASEVEADLAGLSEGARTAIEFEGYAAPEDMAGYYASCDVFCSPATGQESQGIVLLEAMAAGRPPVAFAIPGYRDVVSHGVDGWLVDEPNSEALAEGLGRVLRDRVVLERMGEAGRKTALAYSWPSVAERIESVYENAARIRVDGSGATNT